MHPVIQQQLAAEHIRHMLSIAGRSRRPRPRRPRSAGSPAIPAPDLADPLSQLSRPAPVERRVHPNSPRTALLCSQVSRPGGARRATRSW